MTDQKDAPRFPTSLNHRHGLNEWWPMLADRSAETVVPGEYPSQRFYRCQFVGCGEVVRLDADQLLGAPETISG
jgi:hypothetical protein